MWDLANCQGSMQTACIKVFHFKDGDLGGYNNRVMMCNAKHEFRITWKYNARVLVCKLVYCSFRNRQSHCRCILKQLAHGLYCT